MAIEISIFNSEYIFNRSIFHSHVSLPEGNRKQKKKSENFRLPTFDGDPSNGSIFQGPTTDSSHFGLTMGKRANIHGQSTGAPM